MEDEGVIIETIRIGHQVKVTAIDPVSFVEVSIMGPAGAPRDQLVSVAVQKLRYMLAKKNPR